MEPVSREIRLRVCIHWGLAWLISAAPAPARSFYLGSPGSDTGPGTSGSPWTSLVKANTSLSPGDTLLLKAGTYGASGVRWTCSGTEAKPIVIMAAPGARPVFNGMGKDWLMEIKASHLEFSGIEVTNYSTWAFQIADGSDHVTLRACNLHHILAIDDAAVVTRNCDHITIEDCLFEEMGRSLEQTAFDHALYNSEGGHDIVIRRNVFRNNYGGPAINHYHQPSPYNVSIYDNLFIMQKGAERSGIYAGDGAHDINVYNNTFYLDAKGATKSYGVTLNSGAGTNAVMNNLFYTAAGDAQEALGGPTGNAVDFNFYYPGKDGDDKGAGSISGDPMFVAVGTDFHLKPLSPASNQAKPLTLYRDDIEGKTRPASVWDMGAYQTGDGVGVCKSFPGTAILRHKAGTFAANGARRELSSRLRVACFGFRP